MNFMSIYNQFHKSFHFMQAPECLVPSNYVVDLFLSLRKILADKGKKCLPELYPKNIARKFLNTRRVPYKRNILLLRISKEKYVECRALFFLLQAC